MYSSLTVLRQKAKHVLGSYTRHCINCSQEIMSIFTHSDTSTRNFYIDCCKKTFLSVTVVCVTRYVIKNVHACKYNTFNH